MGSVMVAASLYSVGYNSAISENEGLRYNIISLENILRNVKVDQVLKGDIIA